MSYFSPEEFFCRCDECRLLAIPEEMDPTYMSAMEEIRGELGVALNVSSGIRCPNHPREKEKELPGPHQLRVAGDYVIHGADAFRLIGIAERHPVISGIGLRQHGDIEKRFVHLDSAHAEPHRPRPWVWTYP